MHQGYGTFKECIHPIYRFRELSMEAKFRAAFLKLSWNPETANNYVIFDVLQRREIGNLKNALTKIQSDDPWFIEYVSLGQTHRSVDMWNTHIHKTFAKHRLYITTLNVESLQLLVFSKEQKRFSRDSPNKNTSRSKWFSPRKRAWRSWWKRPSDLWCFKVMRWRNPSIEIYIGGCQSPGSKWVNSG